jgi:hypothetical protein
MRERGRAPILFPLHRTLARSTPDELRAYERAIRERLAADERRALSCAEGQGLDPRDDAIPGAPPFERRAHLALDFRGAPGCAEGEIFEAIVRAHERRWDPWRPLSPWRVTIRVTAHEGLYDGAGWLHDTAGELRWHRTFADRPKCYGVLFELAASMLGVIVGPRTAAAAPIRADDLPPSRYLVNWPTDQLPTQKGDPDPLAPERLPVAIRFGVAMGVEALSAETGSLAFVLDVGFRYRWGSVSLEAHGDPPLGSTFVANGVERYARMTAALLACAHAGVFLACPKAEAGRILFPTRVEDSVASMVYGAAGARLGVEVPVLEQRLFLRVLGDLLAPLGPRAAVVQGQVHVFDLAPFDASLTAGLLVELGK